MADTLTRRSPLQGYRSRFAVVPEAASLSEEPFLAMVDLWVDPAGPDGQAVANVVGIDALPTQASTVTQGPDATVIWFGPQEWLITSATLAGEALERTLRDVVIEHGGAAVDVSAQRTTIRLHGERARELLSKGCSLDLHPAVFGPGHAAQTMLGQAAVVLMPLADDGSDYRILVRSSFAGYLAEWLIDAAEEFGVDW